MLWYVKHLARCPVPCSMHSFYFLMIHWFKMVWLFRRSDYREFHFHICLSCDIITYNFPWCLNSQRSFIRGCADSVCQVWWRWEGYLTKCFFSSGWRNILVNPLMFTAWGRRRRRRIVWQDCVEQMCRGSIPENARKSSSRFSFRPLLCRTGRNFTGRARGKWVIKSGHAWRGAGQTGCV